MSVSFINDERYYGHALLYPTFICWEKCTAPFPSECDVSEIVSRALAYIALAFSMVLFVPGLLCKWIFSCVDPLPISQEEHQVHRMDSYKEECRTFITDHLVQKEVEMALDVYFVQPLPKERNPALWKALIEKGMSFVNIKRYAVAYLDKLDCFIKIQANNERLNDTPALNLRRLHINDRIDQCIIENKLVHFTCVEKSLYLVPLATETLRETNLELTDSNAIVVAKKVERVEEFILNNLTIAQYGELMKVLVIAKVTDLHGGNIFWTMVDGQKRMVIIDTEDQALFILRERGLEYFLADKTAGLLGARYTPYLLKAREIFQRDSKLTEKIIHLIVTHQKGLARFKPGAQEKEKMTLFIEANNYFEMELEDLFAAAGISIQVKLQV